MHSKEKIWKLKYSVLGYRSNLYFDDYKLAMEVDECNYSNRNFNDEKPEGYRRKVWLEVYSN